MGAGCGRKLSKPTSGDNFLQESCTSKVTWEATTLEARWGHSHSNRHNWVTCKTLSPKTESITNMEKARFMDLYSPGTGKFPSIPFLYV